jgi:uncharacterized DUF497 family protein
MIKKRRKFYKLKIRKHGVSFEKAKEVFSDDNANIIKTLPILTRKKGL